MSGFPENDICIVDVDVYDEPGSVARVRELVTGTGFRSLAFMATAVPNEEPLERRLDEWLRRFGLLRDGVADLPARVGILVQALIGHGDRNRIVGRLPFQTIVGADGRQARESFCPLDPAFQAYTRQLIGAFAAASPAFIMIDDDFRIASHDPAERGCMCPLHMERISQKLGVTLSREELVARFQQEEGGETRRLWEELKEQSLVELAQVIRDAIDAVDESIPGTCCCVTAEAHLAPAITATLAGRHRPLARINNAIYLENGHKGLPRRVAQTFQQIALFPEGTPILTEADTCPHNRYSLSATSHIAHVTATTLAGCRGGKYWFPRADADGWRETEPFRRVLAQARPFLDEIEEVRDRADWLGPTVVSRMAEIVRKPWKQQTPFDYPSDGWGWRVFGRMGIPFTVGEGTEADCTPRIMSGTAPFGFSLEKLRQMLAKPLLLDGEAAWHLCGMGLGEYLGVSVEPTDEPCAYEVMHVVPGVERGREVVVGMSGGGRCRLTPASERTVVASTYATGSPGALTLSTPALTWHMNSLGGRVAVYGLSMQTSLEWVFLNSKRKRQLLETLTWLAGGDAPAHVDSDLDVFVMHGKDTEDEATEYVCLFDLNPDPLEDPALALPGERVASVERLAMNGAWESVGFEWGGGSLRCAAAARTMEPLILRLRRGDG